MANVVITGGSRGIGAACVEKFAREGWAVIFLYQKNEKAASKYYQKVVDMFYED
ncbi:MAG: SDR family oxidoreductase [Lentisphaeria bacterium]|nr:SDR family oxidoreductase [Lentisphaeria bacterium]